MIFVDRSRWLIGGAKMGYQYFALLFEVQYHKIVLSKYPWLEQQT
jgi:hypothetical protein